MPDRLPETVDPWRLASRDQVLKGQIELGRFTRLSAALAGLDGSVSAELYFSAGKRRHPEVSGRMTAVLPLVCQRCLQPFEHEVDVTVALTLVESAVELAALQVDTDALIVDQSRCSLAGLLEDELLLALPLIAMHKPGKCSSEQTSIDVPVTEVSENKRDNPFQVLEALKK